MKRDPRRGRLGVCSWSLRPSTPEDLVQKVRACGLEAVQLALDPLRTGAWDVDQTCDALARKGIAILSGMMAMKGEDYSTLQSIRLTGGVRPDQHWESNLRAAEENAALARRLGLSLVTFHAGFIPHTPGDGLRRIMTRRLARLAEVFAAHGVGIALETGQETADTLVSVLKEIPDIGVNFDPANMILYGTGDPVAALRLLAPWVRQVHIKDARPATQAEQWGTEVPVGQGVIDWEGIFRVLHERRTGVDLLIEREGGDDRIGDIRAAGVVVARYQA